MRLISIPWEEVLFWTALLLVSSTHGFFFSLPKETAFSTKRQGTIRIVSWNILAEAYAKPEKYPRTLSNDLEWQTRSKRIIQKIQAFNADIVCLQEVQISNWPGFSSDCQKLGYSCDVVQNVTSGYPVALAILYRSEVVEVMAVESRSRALIAAIRVFHTQKLLFLANIHFQAGLDAIAEEQRFNQLRSLLRRMQFHVAQYSQLLQASQPDSMMDVVFVGDFNMNRSSPLYQLLSTGCRPTFPSNAKVKMSADASLPFLPLVDLYAQYGRNTSFHGSSDSITWNSPYQKPTFRTGCVLDYVFASGYTSASPWEHEDTESADKEIHQSKAQHWPNAEHPSDHWPVGADLWIQ